MNSICLLKKPLVIDIEKYLKVNYSIYGCIFCYYFSYSCYELLFFAMTFTCLFFFNSLYVGYNNCVNLSA